MQFLYALGFLMIPCIANPLPDGAQQLPKRDVQFRVQKERAAAVKEAFQFAWDGYYTYAFPADELNPITKGRGYSRNGWGATAIDALSTAIIMELPAVVNSILNYVPTIDYTHTISQASDVVSVFETTIRYLGGMLAGYDLLDGPFSKLVSNSSRVEVLLAQSKVLADTLSFAFNTTVGIPDNNVAFNSMTRSGQNTGLAVVGSLVLEWTRLSDLTGDPKYANLTQRAEEFLLRPQPPSSEPFPGMLGSEIDINTGKFLDSSGGWVGGSDSFYEYLIKMYVYDARRFGEYRDRWIAAADSSIQYLASHPSTRPDLTFIAQYQGTTPVYQSEHLACFTGGNYLLGGMVLGEQKYIDFGLALTAGCHNTYTSDATKIGPEIFSWLPAGCLATPSSSSNTTAPPPVVPIQKRKLNSAAKSPYPESYPAPTGYPAPIATPQCIDNCYYHDETPTNTSFAIDPTPSVNPACSALPEQSSSFYAQSGFWVSNSYYDLRPEVLESYYYAYRITGDPKYQEWAWEAFVAINKTCRVGAGFSSVRDVNTPGGGGYGNNQESFFFAEVLKYAYMIFAEDGVWQVNHRGNGRERFVFNTESHPVRVVFPPF